jgi:type IV pilus assembly protein PilW
MTPHHQQGLSLVELMIAITLSLVVTMVAIQVFSGSKQSFRVQESQSRLQENARFAIEYLGRSIRQTDFWGGARTGTLKAGSGIGDSAGTSAACSKAWMTDYTRPLMGWTGAADSPLQACTGDDYVPDSDILVVRYADPNTFGSSGPIVVKSRVGRNGAIGTVAEVNAAIDGTATEGVPTYGYHAIVFFLRNFTSGGRVTPSLYWCIPDSTGGCTGLGDSRQPIIEGIEQMKFQYGLDTDNDLVADQYLSADGISTAAQWAQVISVRVNLIVRGDQIDGFADTQSYAMGGGFSYTPEASVRRFQRRLIVKDIQLRNRTRI